MSLHPPFEPFDHEKVPGTVSDFIKHFNSTAAELNRLMTTIETRLRRLEAHTNIPEAPAVVSRRSDQGSSTAGDPLRELPSEREQAAGRRPRRE